MRPTSVSRVIPLGTCPPLSRKATRPAAVAAFDRKMGTDPAADDALFDRLGVGEGIVLVDLAWYRLAGGAGGPAQSTGVPPRIAAGSRRRQSMPPQAVASAA